MIYSNTSSGKALINAIQSPSLLKGLGKQTALNFRSVEDTGKHNSNFRTVFLIPGFMCTAGSMSLIGKELETACNVYYSRLPFKTWFLGSLAEITKFLQNEIETILKNHEKNGDITLIGHSLGGLASFMATMIGTKVEVNNIIQLASPNRGGTPIAQPLSFFPVINDMQNFGVIDQLVPKNKASIKGELISAIAGEDNFIPPENQSGKGLSQVLNYSTRQRDILFGSTEHTDFIVDKIIIREVIKLFEVI